MLTVYKYDLPLEDAPVLRLPKGARILSVFEQHGEARLWALVDPNAPAVHRRLRIAGTGHQLNPADSANFVATFTLRGGAFVFHVFDCGES